jgi:hypothetical protein
MKINLCISAVISSVFFITSCEKKEDHEPVQNSKVINVDLKQNESYSYQILASGDGADAMEISQQAQHALTCKITPDAAHNTLFEYTPATDYTGSDEIHITTVDGEHHEHHDNDHHHGNCQGKDDEAGSSYTFKINITSDNVPKVN